MVVEVEAEDGTCGVGVTIGGEAGCYIVEQHLSRFCEGQDPRNIELMWDPNLSWELGRYATWVCYWKCWVNIPNEIAI